VAASSPRADRPVAIAKGLAAGVKLTGTKAAWHERDVVIAPEPSVPSGYRKLAMVTVVTGGLGFIGRHILARLSQQGTDVVSYDNAPAPAICDLPNIKYLQGCILDTHRLREVLAATRPDVIIHLAAPSVPAYAETHSAEAFKSIVVGTSNILDIASSEGLSSQVIIASSSMVYGDCDDEPTGECHPTRPTNRYGAFKLSAEAVARGYRDRSGVGTTICRLMAVYGPSDRHQRVVGKWIRSALGGEELVIDGDGQTRLNFTFVDDCADGIVRCATALARNHTFNIACGESRSLLDLVAILERHIPGVRYRLRPKPAHIPRRGTIDITKARQRLAFEPMVSLEEGIDRYVRHLKHSQF
jgi:nucleoside-diphosphate-sugar epimerase